MIAKSKIGRILPGLKLSWNNVYVGKWNFCGSAVLPGIPITGTRGQPGKMLWVKKAHFNLNAVNMLRVIWDKWDT